MEQEKALAILKSGKNVFLTGSAGTGKTHTLTQYIKYLKERRVPVAVTASTGIAATHLFGNTIHSWAGIGIKETITNRDLNNMKTKKYLVNNLEAVEVLVIDEISMLHARQLQAVNTVLKYFKKSEHAFGGIQVVLCGDFFQLPPVGNQGEQNKDKFSFMAPAWVEANFNICYLNKQYRQTDNELPSILNQIRENNVSEFAIQLLEEASNNNLAQKEFTKLYSHNLDVDVINQQYLAQLHTKPKTYEAEIKGNEKLLMTLKKSVQTSEKLELKMGAKVMFVKNNPEKGYINGSVGIIENFDDDGMPVVALNDGSVVFTPIETWEIQDDGGKTLAAFKQVPLRLAWAITIHKSQGMTLSEAEIDLSKTFERGQGYVALSRLQSLKGLKLIGFNDIALQVDGLALKADARFKELSKDVDDKTELVVLGKEAIPFLKKCGGITNPEEIKKFGKKLKEKAQKKTKMPTHMITKEYVDKALSLSEIADERGLSTNTIVTHLFKIKEEFPDINIDAYRPEDMVFQEVQAMYKKLLKQNKKETTVALTPLFNALDKKVSFEEIKKCLLFV